MVVFLLFLTLCSLLKAVKMSFSSFGITVVTKIYLVKQYMFGTNILPHSRLTKLHTYSIWATQALPSIWYIGNNNYLEYSPAKTKTSKFSFNDLFTQ